MNERVLESKFRTKLIKELEATYEGCVVIFNPAAHQQGIPDLTVLYGPNWGMLEVKAHANAKHQPNQDYYVDLYNDMSFAAFIYPENKEEILDGLQQALRPRRKARVSQRQ